VIAVRAGVRARAEKANDDRGFTLVELVVAIALLGLILAMVGGFFVMTTQLVSTTRTTSESTGTASNALNEISAVIRSGTDNPVLATPLADPAFVAATGESITMYSYVDSYTAAGSTVLRPQRVQFSLTSDRRVRERRWLPSSSADGNFIFPAMDAAPSRDRIIGGPLAATPAGSAALFVFVNSAGLAMTPPVTGFTQTQLRSIASVTVTVRVGGSGAQRDNTVLLQNSVRLPNLGFTGGTP